MSNSTTGTRPYRSKVHRPCDRCRRRKTACILLAEGPCQSCASATRSCTFDLPPTKRLRRLDPPGPRSSFQEDGQGDHGSLITSPRARSISILSSADPRKSNEAPDVPDSHVLRNVDTTLTSHSHARGATYCGGSPQSWTSNRPSDPPGTVDLVNQMLPPQAVQHVCSLDQINGYTAHLCGISAELDPWLLRHCKYDEFGMRHLHGTSIRNVGGVPVDELVPVHFAVTHAPGGDADARQWELEQLIPSAHGERLVSLY